VGLPCQPRRPRIRVDVDGEGCRVAHLVEAHWPGLKDFFAPRKLSERTLQVRRLRNIRKRIGDSYIVRVNASVEFVDADVLNGSPPMDTIKDHLFRLRWIVSPGFQEAPVQPGEERRIRHSVMYETDINVWSSFSMLLSIKAGSFCNSIRRVSKGCCSKEKMDASNGASMDRWQSVGKSCDSERSILVVSKRRA